MPSKTFIFNILMIFLIFKNVSSLIDKPLGDWKTEWKYALKCPYYFDSCEPIRLLFVYVGIKFQDIRGLTFNPEKKNLGHEPGLYINEKIAFTNPNFIMQFIAQLAGLNGDDDIEALLINIAADNVLDIQQDIIDYKKTDITRNLDELQSTLCDNEYLANNKLSWADFLFAGTITFLNHLMEYDILYCHSKLKNLYSKVLSLEPINKWMTTILHGYNLEMNIYPLKYKKKDPITSEHSSCSKHIIQLRRQDKYNPLFNPKIKSLTDKPNEVTEKMHSFTKCARNPDSKMINSLGDWSNWTCHLLDFTYSIQSEPLRYILDYLNKECKKIRVNSKQWSVLKDFVPFGKLPLLQIGGEIVLNQSIAITRYFAGKAGLAGNNPWEAMLINVAISAISNLRKEIQIFFYHIDPFIRENLNKKLKNTIIPIFLEKWNYNIKDNGGYAINGKFSVADIYLVSILKHINLILDIDLSDDNYPYIKTLKDNVKKEKFKLNAPVGHFKHFEYELKCSNQFGPCEAIRYLLAYVGIAFTDTRLSKWKIQRTELIISGKHLKQTKATIQYIAQLAGINGNNDIEEFFINIMADNVLDIQRDIIDYKKTDVSRKLKELELSMGNNKYLANNKLSWADLLFAGTMSYLNHHIKLKILPSNSKLDVLYNDIMSNDLILKLLKITKKDFQSELDKYIFGKKKRGKVVKTSSGKDITETPTHLTEEMLSFINCSKTLDSKMINSNWSNSTYKLLDFEYTILGEPISNILQYKNIDLPITYVNYEQWLELKETIPFGELPLLQIDGKIVLNQSKAIARYFAGKVGLTGSNPWETMLINTAVGYISDLQMDIERCYYEINPDIKDRMINDLKNSSIPEFLSIFDTLISDNGGYIVNDKLSMADVYLVTILKHVFYLFGDDIITFIMDLSYKASIDAYYPNIRNLIMNVKQEKNLSLILKEWPNRKHYLY